MVAGLPPGDERRAVALRALGVLYAALGAFSLGMAGLALALGDPDPRVTTRIVAVFSLLGALGIGAGIGLARLRAGARYPALLLSILVLPAAPAGTMLGAWGLYLLLTAPGPEVLAGGAAGGLGAARIEVSRRVALWLAVGAAVIAAAAAVWALVAGA